MHASSRPRSAGPRHLRRRARAARAAATFTALAVLLLRPGLAHSDDASDEVRRLREDLAVERRARADLERRFAELEDRVRATAAAAPVAATPPPAPTPAPAPTQDDLDERIERQLLAREMFEAAPPMMAVASPNALLDVSLVLSAQFGASTATDAALGAIALGDHDPHVRGANVRNEELVLTGDVDPWFRGVLDVVFKIDEEGESSFELEEAYGVTTSLPCGLQAKFGQFFTEFGRANPTHPHTWEFLDVPVVLGRVFGGDGLRGQGARLSWLVPTTSGPTATVLAGFQNARGETQHAFLGEEGEEFGEHEALERDVARVRDLSFHGRLAVSDDARGPCGGTLSWLAGASVAVGPNGTGDDGHTTVVGTDLYLKWRPASTEAGWPWLSWQTEALWRGFHADAQTRVVDDGMGGTSDLFVPSRRYDDWGLYSQVVWGFARPWSIGARFDYADSDGVFAGPHLRASLALTYYPSEFSRVRLEARYDDVEGLSSAFDGDRDENWSVWLGFELTLGAHGAHGF